MRGKNLVKFLLVIIMTGVLTLIAFYGWTVPGTNVRFKSAKENRYGIDIKGGARITFGADQKSGITPTDKDMQVVKTVIEKRLDNKNIFDKTVAIETSTKRVIVEIPWRSDEKDFNPNKAVEELGKTALLTFRELIFPEPNATPAVVTTPAATSAVTSESVLSNTTDASIVPATTASTTPAVTPQTNPSEPKPGPIILSGMEVAKAEADYNNDDGYHVKLTFNSEGSKKFSQATARLVGKQIAIYMDDILISAPTVNTAITGNTAIITLGKGQTQDAKAEATTLANSISSGALPFKLVSMQVESISPLLGENALNVIVYAGLISLILVWIFMLIYYRLPGIMANIALIAHTVIQLLFISSLQISLTLPGIAGIILTIGMGVDANVIIFERIKEELRNGKTLRLAIDVGFKRAFSAILDANITTLIASVVLFIFGTGPVQSFAITLGLGVLLSFFTAITASRIMLRSVSDINIAKHTWLYGAAKKEVQ